MFIDGDRGEGNDDINSRYLFFALDKKDPINVSVYAIDDLKEGDLSKNAPDIYSVTYNADDCGGRGGLELKTINGKDSRLVNDIVSRRKYLEEGYKISEEEALEIVRR